MLFIPSALTIKDSNNNKVIINEKEEEKLFRLKTPYFSLLFLRTKLKIQVPECRTYDFLKKSFFKSLEHSNHPMFQDLNFLYFKMGKAA